MTTTTNQYLVDMCCESGRTQIVLSVCKQLCSQNQVGFLVKAVCDLLSDVSTSELDNLFVAMTCVVMRVLHWHSTNITNNTLAYVLSAPYFGW
jgi:hypothetical protein